MSVRLLAACCLSAVLLAACAAQAPRVQPGAGETVKPSEEGLLMVSRRGEEAFAMSGLRVDDPDLAGYIERVNCRVAGPYCPEIRVYTAAMPDFNASMAPNGFMQVWTGLLLRVENEAQLATVLGHETSHYALRHSLERLETTQRTANVLLAAQMGMLAGGAGGVAVGPVRASTGGIGQLIASGYLASYSRGQEAESDREGFEMMVEAGYAPGEAAEVWRHLMEEREACDLPSPPALFASHPPSEERLEALQGLARQSGKDGETGRDRFLAATLPHRGEWLRMEVATRQLCRVRVVIERLLEQPEGHGVLRYYLGEVYRLRGEDGDLERAVEAYREALRHADAPPQTHRELGLALWRSGDTAAARAAFQRYLQADTKPEDAAMVHAYLAELS